MLRICDCLVTVTHSIRNLGVQFVAEITTESHVTAVCRSAIYHLRNISRIRRHLTAAATEQFIHAFFTSRLDVGNILIHRLPVKQIQRLQKVQNRAACLVDGASKYSHATPLLMKLHWLSIAVGIEFKILLLTHWGLTGHPPRTVCKQSPVSYVAALQQIHYLLYVPRTRRHWGDRTFSLTLLLLR